MSENQQTFFGEAGALEALSQAGDPLETLSGCIDFEAFRAELEKTFIQAGAKGPGGRPRWDAVLIFKALVLQRIYNLSDEQMEYQSRDRLSFHRFLGLGLGERVPDSRTLWAYREKLVQTGAAERLFQNFHERLLAQGLITKTGTLVDATFVTVPRQRNTREENASIKAGKAPGDWKDQPDKLRQKDLEARWTLKNHVATYGYKNHVKVDAASKLIVAQKVTPANANDGQQLADLVRADDKTVFADCAYQTPSNRALLKQLDIENKIQVKGAHHVALTAGQKADNHGKSKIRCRVEHVFGLINTSMSGLHLEYIGLKRITAAVTLINLVHNFIRLGQLQASARA